MWITFLKKIWMVRKPAISLWYKFKCGDRPKSEQKQL